MKNLTQTDGTGNWTLGGIPWAELAEGAVLTKENAEKLCGALCKLRDYEKTGLTPQEAADVNDFNKTSTARLLEKLGEKDERFKWTPAKTPPEDSKELVLVQASGWPKKNIHLQDSFQLAYYSKKDGWILEEYPDWDVPEIAAWFPLPDAYEPDPEDRKGDAI